MLFRSGTAGFVGKLNIFLGALMVDPAHYVLVSIMIATTVVSYFYYFGIMTQMFFRPAADDAKIELRGTIAAVIIIAAAGTILFGVMPSVAMDFLNTNFNQFMDFMK